MGRGFSCTHLDSVHPSSSAPPPPSRTSLQTDTSSSVLKHLSVSCLDWLTRLTVFPVASCCSAEFPLPFPLLSLSHPFFSFIRRFPFFRLSMSPPDNPPFSHSNSCPALPVSLSVSPSISHHARLHFAVVPRLLNSYQNASPRLRV